MSGGYSVKYQEERKTQNGGEDDVEEDDVEDKDRGEWESGEQLLKKKRRKNGLRRPRH